jgi:glucose-6-phosphate isomerase
MPPSEQVFGLWVEQLVAESLGKQGKGILPNVEVDASMLGVPRDDRSAITYQIGAAEGFSESVANFDPSIPVRHYELADAEEVLSSFVAWEYAIAFLGIMLDVNPFDQPDVEATKVRVRELLANGAKQISPTSGSLVREFNNGDPIRTLRISQALLDTCSEARSACDISADVALRMLVGSLRKGDYFAINAFLPFRGYGRREALERMRNRVASRLGVASCLEIGPRYLHSTGQLHKGGPNTGVFLYLSADEDNDIVVPGEGYTLGELAAIQAQADFETLAARGRRAVHVHLAGNDSETLSRFADRLCAAISAVKLP